MEPREEVCFCGAGFAAVAAAPPPPVTAPKADPSEARFPRRPKFDPKLDKLILPPPLIASAIEEIVPKSNPWIGDC